MVKVGYLYPVPIRNAAKQKGTLAIGIMGLRKSNPTYTGTLSPGFLLSNSLNIFFHDRIKIVSNGNYI